MDSRLFESHDVCDYIAPRCYVGRLRIVTIRDLLSAQRTSQLFLDRLIRSPRAIRSGEKTIDYDSFPEVVVSDDPESARSDNPVTGYNLPEVAYSDAPELEKQGIEIYDGLEVVALQEPSTRTVTPLHLLGHQPDWIDCPFCERRVRTITKKKPSNLTHMQAAFLLVATGPGAAIPYAAKWGFNTEHHCENCDNKVAQLSKGKYVFVCKCDALVAASLDGFVFFPPDAEYEASISSYYSVAVQQLRPWCIVRPHTSEQVSRALTALVAASPAGSWDIAVRGGGHSHFASNNVANGVTIDLSRMNWTVYNKDSELAFIGPGSRWGSVYSEIEKYERSLTGGRLASVGVSGLVLGGGISFHTGTRGFACDAVKNYEVVLANGSIVNANEREHVDLFKALKGGSSNFGIVTRFDMETFEAAKGGIYGGILRYNYEHKAAVLDQLVRMIDMNHEHPEDAMPIAFMSSGSGPTTIIAYTVNTLGIENSTSFASLAALPNIGDTRRRLSYGQLISASPDSSGERTVWFSICFQNKIKILTKLMDLYDGLVADLRQVIAEDDLSVQFVLQPLPIHYSQKGAGSNVLGLDQTLIHNSVVWNAIVDVKTVEQEALARTQLAALVAELETFTALNDASTPWRFLNYVNPAQDPIKSYGEDNVQFLKDVAAKYDPQGVFQTRVSGGFKVSRVGL
ncbi:hypothetical protein AK830_g7988 [Neonectria ditissima]|uniref:FAD-binding PCMH-type domain-containing protein n=1 Tax=Neonectria ditissima TaxID=78410 RepID=A0A0P7BDL6_9HYPO|nr:hypothetical protein AK830_g7988 [Neonectria ditissima]